MRPERASLSFAFLLYLPPLWCAACPRSESSVGDPVIICPPLWRAAQAGQLIIAFVRNLPPLWRAARPRSERSLGGPVIICLLFHLPALKGRGPSGPAYHCLSVQFAPVMARGPSLERALHRQPSYHLPFVSFAHLYDARPEWASFSLPFGQFSLVMARGPSGPAYHCLLHHLPPLWHAARPRNERSVGSPVIICLLFHLPTFMTRGPSGPAFQCLLPNFPPLWRAARAGQLINGLLLFIERGPGGPANHLRGPSGPVCHLPLCLICGAPRPV